MKNKALIKIIIAAAVCCGIMALIDGVVRPGYAVKSAIKIGIFALIPLLLAATDKNLIFKETFRFHKKGFAAALGLGAGLYVLILGAYFAVRNLFDFSAIAGNLTQNAGVTKDNFLFVSLYISFANSLLEEFFFRGFLFLNLKKLGSRRFAYSFSACAFALYHVAMMSGWFSWWLWLLVMAGLTVCGMIFNWLNEKLSCIYVSWLVHMFANFAINTIGFMLLNA